MAEVKGKECLDLAGAMTRLQKQNTLCPRGSPLGDPGPLGDLFVDLGPL